MFPKASVKTRLILWNAGVLMFILCILSGGVYLFMRNSLAANVRNKVDGGYNTVETVLRNSDGDIMDLYHLGQDLFYSIRKGGKTIFLTRAWEGVAWTKGLNWNNLHPYQEVASGDTKYWLKRGIVEDYGYQILFAYNTTGAFDSLGSLVVILISAVPVAMVLAVLGGYFLAVRALAPIKEITRKARQISAENLNERLPVINPHDEFGHLAQTFNETLTRLDGSFDRLRRFTADASHELRTPLTSIRSVGEVALSGSAGDNSCREAIGSMLEETGRLTHLVDSLLALARLDSRKIELTFEPLDVNRLIAEVVEELHVLAEDKKQMVALEESPSFVISGDRATLRQALSNVIHNSIRYTQDGGDIHIRVKNMDLRLCICVEDNGPGVPEPERAKVFERFYRVDKARSRMKGGTGLGLSIAKWAVEAHGGSIEFCGRTEPGSCCQIILPLSGQREEEQ